MANLTISVPDELISAVGHDFVENVLAYKSNELIVLLKKQADYGPDNIARCPIGPLNGLIVRLFDKVSRLTHLSSSGRNPEHETLADTGLDIANYGTIVSMVITGHWPHLPAAGLK